MITTQTNQDQAAPTMTTADLQQLRAELARRDVRFTWSTRYVCISDPACCILVAHTSPRLDQIIQGLRANQPLTAFLQPRYSGS